MTRFKRILFQLGGTCLLAGSPTAAQSVDHQIQTVCVGIFENIYALEFDLASRRIDTLIARKSDHPAGYFLSASLNFYKMVTGIYSRKTRQAFFEAHAKVLELTENCSDRQKDDCLFFRGAAFGNLGRYHGSRGEWGKAFFNAKKARGLHSELLQHRPQAYDAYFAIWLVRLLCRCPSGSVGIFC